ncbi:hypothetical protein [Hydrocarboniclastica marina]|uniref:Uncharacterized protein n=1 Tax=Hydrocarboniclastica marina TaxID=2259620 RepID=A0A4P7XIE4_9ALTE|nr:hypothetical protein [Hydrocarboniclastica marina]QCF26495.1 hypothetical protein soil367_11410 [Hydrocarboniclastica marina]
MLNDPKNDPKSWEAYFKDILRRFYGPSNMKDIPDSYGGDFGIECYSFSGHVFQCYLPEQISDKEKLTKLQKDKIRKDIQKFTVKNVKKFAQLFEGMQISRWILATPEYYDSDMAMYCSEKSGKVRKLGLSYVSPDFQILLQTESDYRTEVRALQRDSYQLLLNFSHVEEDMAADWISQNLSFLKKIDLKLPKIVDPDKIDQMKSFLVQKYLGYQNLLDHLRVEWPDIHVTINALINNRRSYLEARFLTDCSKQPGAVIQAEIQQLKDDISSEIPTLKKTDLELIKYGVIADWLIRCPLDF